MKYRAGVLLPWTKPPYGYRLNPDRPRDPSGVWVDEAEAAVVREIFAWYASDGSSLCALAEHLQAQGVPTPSGKRIWSLCTLRSILRQPAYLGQVYACRYRYRPARVRRSATHPIGRPHDSLVERPEEEWIPVAAIPAIIAQEQYDLVQLRLLRNQSFAKRNNKVHPYLLRALVSCGFCQSSCIARHLKGGYNYYVCAAKSKAIHSRKEEKCPSCFVRADQLDDLVWRDLCEVLTHPESIAQAMERAVAGEWLPQQLQGRREQVRGAQHRLEQQLDRLTEAYLGEVIPLAEYQRRRHDLDQKLQALRNQESQLLIQVDRQQEVSGLVATVEDFCRRVQVGLADATFEQRRQLVELLIDRVIVANGDVEIHYVIPTAPRSEHVRFCHLRSDYFDAPDVVRVARRDISQQVRIDLMLQITLAQVGARADTSDTHLPHVALHRLAVDRQPLPSQCDGDAPRTIERVGSVELVDPMLKGDLLCRWRHRPVVETRTAQPEQLRLHAQRQFNGLALDEGQALGSTHR